MEGWIKQHRKIKNHWLYKEKRVFSKFEAWNDILLNINHSDTKVLIKDSLVEVKAGQSILSLDSWALRWSWSKSKVRRFLKLLEDDGMIELENVKISTRLTVCNYANYQDKRNTSETQVKRKRNTSETQVAPNKNEENEENDKNDKKKQSFEIFWDLYNKKVDKKKTFDKWKNLSQKEIDEIIEITPKYVEANSDSQYRKNPLTFLNGRCWEDEIQQETKQSTNIDDPYSRVFF